MPIALSGSYLPYRKRVFYFLFGYSDQWYDKFLPGFTHVSLVEVKGSKLIVYEPLRATCFTLIKSIDDLSAMASNYTSLRVSVRCSKAQRLIGFKFNTCATFVQYIAGISTGAILVQTLYERLLNRQIQGLGVTKWEPKP